MRRSVRVALALGVVAFGLAAPALPGLAATCAGATAQAGAAGPTIRVGVAVDDGASTPRVECIVVPAKTVQGKLRATGAAVLAARATQLGLPAPRWGASGLLCGIDGAPATGCTEPSSAGYVYWSYWQGETGQWIYSSTGPAYRYLEDGMVDGWRFGSGGGTGQDTSPRVSAVAARCPSTPEPAPPVTAPPSPTPTSPAGGGNATSPPTTRPGSTSGSRPRTNPGSKAAATTVAPAGGQAAGQAPAPPTTTLPAPGEPTTAPGAPTTTTTIEAEVAAASQERAADTVAIPADGSGGGGWVGTAVGVGALGAAAAGLTILGRRRRSDS